MEWELDEMTLYFHYVFWIHQLLKHWVALVQWWRGNIHLWILSLSLAYLVKNMAEKSIKLFSKIDNHNEMIRCLWFAKCSQTGTKQALNFAHKIWSKMSNKLIIEINILSLLHWSLPQENDSFLYKESVDCSYRSALPATMTKHFLNRFLIFSMELASHSRSLRCSVNDRTRNVFRCNPSR